MDAATLVGDLDAVQVVDVRYAPDWRAGHIAESINIPEDDLAERVDELDPDRPVVVVCRAGARSADAAEWLRGQGFDAQSMDGGMLAWKWAGQPVTPAEDDPPATLDDEAAKALHDEFMEIALAVQQRFGPDVEPTEEQIREFLRERMIGEGKTPEEADAFFAELDEG